MKRMPGFSAEASLHKTHQQFQMIEVFKDACNTIQPQQVDDAILRRRPRCDAECLSDCLTVNECQNPPPPLNRVTCRRLCRQNCCGPL
jgi:hypothetical protein